MTKQSTRGQIRKMAGKQQKDYWRDMTRRGDVRFTVNKGDKDNHLLTSLHFNWRNKKLVLALCVLSWRRCGRQRTVMGKIVETWWDVKAETCIFCLTYHKSITIKSIILLKFIIIWTRRQCFKKTTIFSGPKYSTKHCCKYQNQPLRLVCILVVIRG